MNSAAVRKTPRNFLMNLSPGIFFQDIKKRRGESNRPPPSTDPDGAGTFSASGVYGDPTLATKEKGRIIVEATVREMVRQVRELIEFK
jgi:creatinine amidohydrolase/Fe(II)-dependent formamide hydrolase-like protein